MHLEGAARAVSQPLSRSILTSDRRRLRAASETSRALRQISFDDVPGFDLARPADHGRHAEGAFPVGVLLAAERRHGAVRPRVHMRPVVGRVDHDGVVGDAEVVERLEQLCRRGRRARACRRQYSLSPLCCGRDAPAAHACRGACACVFIQTKNGLFAFACRCMKSIAASRGLVVDRLHALLGERAGVLDLLLADLAEARVDGGVVGVGGRAFEHAARTELRAELRVLGIVGMLRLLLGVEVIEVAEELIEAVRRSAGTRCGRPSGSCRTGRWHSRAA